MIVRWRKGSLWFFRVVRTSDHHTYVLPHYVTSWSCWLIVLCASVFLFLLFLGSTALTSLPLAVIQASIWSLLTDNAASGASMIEFLTWEPVFLALSALSWTLCVTCRSSYVFFIFPYCLLTTLRRRRHLSPEDLPPNVVNFPHLSPSPRPRPRCPRPRRPSSRHRDTRRPCSPHHGGRDCGLDGRFNRSLRRRTQLGRILGTNGQRELGSARVHVPLEVGGVHLVRLFLPFISLNRTHPPSFSLFAAASTVYCGGKRRHVSPSRHSSSSSQCTTSRS